MHKHLFVSLTLLLAVVATACVAIEAPAAPQPSVVDSSTEPAPEPFVISRAVDVPRISVEEAKAYFDSGNAVFVDSRSVDSYNSEHITGALPRPEDTPPALDTSIPKDQLIITYCT